MQIVPLMLNQVHREGQSVEEEMVDGGSVLDDEMCLFYFNQEPVLMRTCVSKTAWLHC